MTFSIKKAYFDLYYQGQEADYTLESRDDGDVYKRTISQSDLTLNWDNPTMLGLTYTITPSSDGHSVGGFEFIR